MPFCIQPIHSQCSNKGARYCAVMAPVRGGGSGSYTDAPGSHECFWAPPWFIEDGPAGRRPFISALGRVECATGRWLASGYVGGHSGEGLYVCSSLGWYGTARRQTST